MKQNKPLFTVIIPAYNVEHYIVKCIDSVVAQTFADWECICVDDGSTDKTGDIIDRFSRVDARIKILHQRNAGVSSARNAALDIATGEWIQFLDGDDSFEQDFLNELSKVVNRDPEIDAIEHTAIYCFADGKRVYGDKGVLPPSGVVPASAILKDPWGRKYTSLGRCACYKIFRRSVIEQNHLRFAKGIPLGEDSLFAGQFYAYARKIDIHPEIAGYLRIFRAGSAIHNITFEKLSPMFKGAEVMFNTWLQHNTKEFACWVAARFISLSFLGSDYGNELRQRCITELMRSDFYNNTAIPFILRHGTWKGRLYAFTYLISPKRVRRYILENL